MKAELARAYLLYGEWLRRERRRTDARAQLRVAHDMFETMGMEAFEKRARRELLAAGEKARKSTPAHGVEQLTAAGGPDRATGPGRTVEHRDRWPTVPQRPHRPVPPAKVFAKLGISSRNQLEIVLPSGTGRLPRLAAAERTLVDGLTRAMRTTSVCSTQGYLSA